MRKESREKLEVTSHVRNKWKDKAVQNQGKERGKWKGTIKDEKLWRETRPPV